MNQPIYFANSRLVVVWASICYSCIIIAILLCAFPLFISIPVIALLALDYRRVIYQYALTKGQFSLICMQYDCGKWMYQLRNGRCYKGQLQRQGSFSSALLLVMKFKHLGGVRTVVVPRDSISRHNYRFLAFHLYNI